MRQLKMPAKDLARYVCNDCGINVVTAGEFYMLKPDIWKGQLGLGWTDNLCIGCLETRLGRKVSLRDMGSFPDYPWMYPTSPRLLNRYGFQATELKIRNLALHLALCVRRDGSRLVLHKRYGDRQKIGAYRTWEAVNRALEKYIVEQARLLGTYVATPRATAELVPPVQRPAGFWWKGESTWLCMSGV